MFWPDTIHTIHLSQDTVDWTLEDYYFDWLCFDLIWYDILMEKVIELSLSHPRACVIKVESEAMVSINVVCCVGRVEIQIEI